mmetsp:Transcript_42593/g.40859  ORF Transcript_42593/g.40859 Transcript_42593/m.40859 type:complete len:93 (-) Transcript_42593:2384-2662(-)
MMDASPYLIQKGQLSISQKTKSIDELSPCIQDKNEGSSDYSSQLGYSYAQFAGSKQDQDPSIFGSQSRFELGNGFEQEEAFGRFMGAQRAGF